MVSVVICSRETERFSRTLQMYSYLLREGPFEVIRIPDAQSMAEGYNRGLARSCGEVLIFSHDDLAILRKDFRKRLLEHLNHCDVVGVAGTDRLCDANWLSSGPPHLYGQVIHPGPNHTFEASIYAAPAPRISDIQAMDGVFLACRREVVETIRFDEQTFTGFHQYDLDFTYRAFRAGYRLAVCTDLDVLHESLGNYDQAWEQQAQRFRDKHGPTLAPNPRRQFQYSIVASDSLPQAVELLRPRHWKMYQHVL